MNYFDYENHFWREDDMENFSPTATRVYFYLLTLANRNFWQGDIVISDAQFSAKVGVALNSFKKGRTELINRKLIEIEQGGKGYARKTRYRLRCRGSGQVRNQDRCSDSYQPVTPLYNKTKTETKSKYFNSKNGNSKRGFNTSKGDFD